MQDFRHFLKLQAYCFDATPERDIGLSSASKVHRGDMVNTNYFIREADLQYMHDQ